MKVSVLISTFNRPNLLRQTVNSICASTHKDLAIYVMLDGNPALIDVIAKMPVALIYNRKRLDWIRSMNKGMNYAIADAVIYASDDLIFDPRCIENAVDLMKKKTKDGDALIAIKQNIVGCSTAFGLMGRAFIERFPGRKVFCPNYIHYVSDLELGNFARSVGRCYMCDTAKVTHLRLKDQTYHLAKKVEKRDIAIKDIRKEKGYLWGRDFNLVEYI